MHPLHKSLLVALGLSFTATPATQAIRQDALRHLTKVLSAFITNLNGAQPDQEEVAFSASMLDADLRDEALRALHAAQRAMPAIADLLASSSGAPTSLNTELMPSTPVNLSEAYDAPIPVAELSVRTHNALRKAQITTIGQFCEMELSDLMWLRNFGKKATAEVFAYRARLGVPLAA